MGSMRERERERMCVSVCEREKGEGRRGMDETSKQQR